MKLHSLLLRRMSHPKPPWNQYLHTSTSTEELEISNEVLTILETINPMEPALESMVPFLSPDIVTSIVQNPPNSELGFRFFIWASKYRRFRLWESHNTILDMLVKKNGLELYWQALEQVKKCKLTVPASAFNVLIQAYVKMGKDEKALEVFGLMKDFDCEPDVYIYNVILHVLLRNNVLLLALAIYNRILKLNCLVNKATFDILIHGLCKSGKTQDALQMFDEMEERQILPNKYTYTIIISGLCRAQKVDDAYRLFNTMKDSRCNPDFVTYNALLNGLCKLGRVDEAFALLRSFQKEGYVLGARAYGCLINGLFRAKRFEEALTWYGKMIEDDIKPDIVLYTIVMKGLSEAGRVADALELLKEMTERGVVPDTYCYNALIKGFVDMGLLDQAKSLRLEISEHGFFPNAYTYTILICGMCRDGLVGEAQQMFSEMEKLGCYPSVVTFNALIDGLCKAGELEKAHILFYKMEIGRNPSLFLRLSQGPNRVLDGASLQTMVEQLCDSGLILKAYKILKQLADSGVVPDIKTYNILINGFCKAGNINGAFKIFKELQLKGLSPDAVTYGTIINGLQMLGREEDAFKLFDQMEKDGYTPSTAIYKSLMTWSCRRRKVSLAFSLWLKYLRQIPVREDEAVRAIEDHFEEGEVEKAVRGLLGMDFKLNDFELAPYTIWLIGLCQAGRVEEASKLFFILEEDCKVTVTPPSCVHLISGLCKEGNLDLAIYVFLYTIDKGFMLKPRICNRLLMSLLLSEDKRNHAFDLLSRMKFLGYNLAYLYRATKLLLHGHGNMQNGKT